MIQFRIGNGIELRPWYWYCGIDIGNGLVFPGRKEGPLGHPERIRTHPCHEIE